MPDRFIILLVGSTAAIWATLIMSREEPSGEVEEAEVGEHEEIVVEEDSTRVRHHILQHCHEFKSTTHWIAGDVPLKGLLPSAENRNVLSTFVCMIYFCNRPWLCPR